MTFFGRIGQFLFFIGFLGLVIFFATDQAGMPRYTFFCGGFVMFIFGVYMMWRYRNPPEPSDRFRMLRRMSENRELKRQEIEKRKYAASDERRQSKGS